MYLLYFNTGNMKNVFILAYPTAFNLKLVAPLRTETAVLAIWRHRTRLSCSGNTISLIAISGRMIAITVIV